MPNLFALTIPDDPDALLVTYGAGALIRVQSSPTAGGIYGAVTTFEIVSGQTVYAVYDATGAAGYSYKYRYEAASPPPTGSYSAAFQPTPGNSIYATLADLKTSLGIGSSDTTQDALLEFALGASSRAIFDACQRDFYTPTGISESRYFRLVAYQPPYIEIDDLVDDTGLTIAFDDGSGSYPSTISTALDLLPLNAPTRGFPYTRISFRTYTQWPAWRWGGPFAKVTSARWGWPAIPSAVTQACLIQASRLYKRKDSPFGIAGSPVEGNPLRLLAKLDPDVQLLLGGDLERYPGFVG